MSIGLSYTSIKVIQGAIQKCITWPKNLGKCRQAWDKARIDSRLRPIKLNMLMKMR